MKGSIKTVIGEKKWYNQKTSKDVFFLSVEMSNGDKGEIWQNSPGEYKAGQEVDYTLKENGEGRSNSIMIAKSDKTGFKAREWKGEDVELKLASMSVSYAKDLVVAGKIELKDMSAYSEKIALKTQEVYLKLKASKPADATV